ncbi:hypothetical protein ACQJBY_069538 [Aegilops geniculata]
MPPSGLLPELGCPASSPACRCPSSSLSSPLPRLLPRAPPPSLLPELAAARPPSPMLTASVLLPRRRSPPSTTRHPPPSPAPTTYLNHPDPPHPRTPPSSCWQISCAALWQPVMLPRHLYASFPMGQHRRAYRKFIAATSGRSMSTSWMRPAPTPWLGLQRQTMEPAGGAAGSRTSSSIVQLLARSPVNQGGECRPPPCASMDQRQTMESAGGAAGSRTSSSTVQLLARPPVNQGACPSLP